MPVRSVTKFLSILVIPNYLLLIHYSSMLLDSVCLNKFQTLGDCSCVGAAGTAMPGSCDSGCQMWILYIVALGLGTVIHGMASVPTTTICLR